MKYFPLRDPFSDVVIMGGRDALVVTLFIGGETCGMLRIKHAQLADFLSVISEPIPIAEYDALFDTGTEWFRDYTKDHLVSEDGVVIHKDDVP